MAGIASTPRQLASIWQQIDVNQKISILLVALGSVAAVVGLVYWSGHPNYGLLYSNLSRKDAAAVVAQLDGDAIPYRLSDGGTTVLVPADRVQQARGKLLMQGIPAGGDGFEILDKGRLGMTNFAERKTYLRAVQGELARTISAVNAVEWARVHISAPEPSVFLDRDRPASASVLIKARGGARLEPGQIASIASLVARSVEGLEPKNITITDQFLAPLSRAVHDDGPGAATAYLEAQRGIERHLSRKVREMLDATLGPGRSSVSVCAEIQLKQETQNSTEYNLEGRVARMEKTRTSKSSGSKTGAGGAAGVASNVSARGGAPAAAGGSTESETDETMEYEVPRKEIVRVDNGVTVTRLTVSALVAGTHKVEKDSEGKETKKFEPLPADEVAKLSDAVKQAVGYDESRKDIVKVECVEFNEPAPAVTAEELAGERRWELILRLAKHGSTVVVVLAFLLVMRSVARRTRAAREAAAAAAAEAAAKAPAARQGGAGAAQTGEAPLRERVSSAIQEDADSASDLLKSWYETAGTR